MKVRLEVDISRTSGSRDDFPMSVSVTDATSGCRILEVSFGLADFMEILTGRCGISGDGEFYENIPIGCTPENKEEEVPQPKGYKADDGEAKRILAPFEVDGWEARVSDLYNHHRWCDGNKMRVTFFRHIRPDGTVWEPRKG